MQRRLLRKEVMVLLNGSGNGARGMYDLTANGEMCSDAHDLISGFLYFESRRQTFAF